MFHCLTTVYGLSVRHVTNSLNSMSQQTNWLPPDIIPIIFYFGLIAFVFTTFFMLKFFQNHVQSNTSSSPGESENPKSSYFGRERWRRYFKTYRSKFGRIRKFFPSKAVNDGGERFISLDDKIASASTPNVNTLNIKSDKQHNLSKHFL